MENDKIYQLEIFKYAQISFKYVAEALTPLPRLGTFSLIVTHDSHQKMSQFPTLVAAHQAEVRGPPVGRGPQVENRCTRQLFSAAAYNYAACERPGGRRKSRKGCWNSKVGVVKIRATWQHIR